MKLALARALLVSGLILLMGCLTSASLIHRTRCRIIVVPRTVQCADGHVYIVHDHYLQDLGPTSPVPAIPKA